MSSWSSPQPLIGEKLLEHLRKKNSKNQNHHNGLVTAVGKDYVSFRDEKAARDQMIKSVKKSEFWKKRGYTDLTESVQQNIAQGMWKHTPLIFDKRCARCRLVKAEKEMLGGTFGGVVCRAHKVCEDCWFQDNGDYGARAFEPKPEIPIAHRPRKGASPVCYGCHYRVPFSVYRIDICLQNYYPHLQPTEKAYLENVIELD